MYRLGMYASVVAARPIRLGWWGLLAKAVSYAACGKVDEAREAVAVYLRCPGADAHLEQLASDLAPFRPDQALQLAQDSPRISPALLCGLLLRSGQVEEARQLLDSLSPDTVVAKPELQLLRTNAFGGTPGEQLQRLNAFLGSHGVSALRLIHVAHAPSPVNIAVKEPPAPQEGPLVTVLMTTFRTGPRVLPAIESVLLQSYRQLELVVVDDASGDDTPKLVRDLAQRDSRLRFVALDRNVGTYAAKLIGLSQARGEFVTCHDSDDWSHPVKIARQVAPLLSDERLVGTVSNLVRIQDDGAFYARAVHPLMRLNPSSLLFRRERVLREAGAWDCVRTGADSELLARLRVVFGPRAIRKIRQPLALASHRPDSLMTATSTGYSETGISPERLAYWEAWSHWHIEALAHGRRPYLPAEPLAAARARPFPVPQALRVPIEYVEESVASVAASKDGCAAQRGLGRE